MKSHRAGQLSTSDVSDDPAATDQFDDANSPRAEAEAYIQELRGWVNRFPRFRRETEGLIEELQDYIRRPPASVQDRVLMALETGGKTRAEIEQITGLEAEQVHNGLRKLINRRVPLVVVRDAEPLDPLLRGRRERLYFLAC